MYTPVINTRVYATLCTTPGYMPHCAPHPGMYTLGTTPGYVHPRDNTRVWEAGLYTTWVWEAGLYTTWVCRAWTPPGYVGPVHHSGYTSLLHHAADVIHALTVTGRGGETRPWAQARRFTLGGARKVDNSAQKCLREKRDDAQSARSPSGQTDERLDSTRVYSHQIPY